jgi:two-component system, LytTR family, sensor kinase
LHILIWGAVLILPYLLIPTEGDEGHRGLLHCNFFTLTNIIHIGLFYFNAFFLYSRLLTRSRWWMYLLSIALVIAGFYLIKIFILMTWFPTLASSEEVFRVTFFPTIFFLVISTIYRLVLDKINYEKALVTREAEQLATELKFLRSQISPHFLFNVLNNLVSMARHKSDQLESSLIKLSGLMRYMLYESDGRKVTIEKEIEYLESYIELQKLRFEEDVEITSDIRCEAGTSHTIEPMLLIPFVENAFKHGVALVLRPFIRINLRVTGNTLRFNVENKFGTNQSKDRDSGIGLSNVKARLNLLYPELHQLSVEERDNIFLVDLSLQLK